MIGAATRPGTSRWRALATGLAAALGLAAPVQAQTQSLTPEAAPLAWIAYAETATHTIRVWLEEEGEAPSNLRRSLHETRPAPDQPTPSLELKLWVDPDGVVSRIGTASLVQDAINADLQSSVHGRRLPPPPAGMLQPLRIAVQLEP